MSFLTTWGSLLAITVIPGFGLLSATKLKFSFLERLILGFALGLASLCLGGALASWVQLDMVRWIPSALASLGWFYFKPAAVQRSLKLLLLGLIGILVSIPTLLNTLGDQPIKWAGIWSFYTDLPFQIALVAETGFRPGQTLPWSVGAPLEYTWLLHSALGSWGQLAGLTADSIVLFYWPIIYSILLPLLVALLTWRISQSYWAVLLVECLLPFVRASSSASLRGDRLTPLHYPLSPTFEGGIIFVLAGLLLILQFSRMEAASVRSKLLSLAPFAVVVLAATGTKGSSWFLLIGAQVFLALSRRIATKRFDADWVLPMVVTVAVGLLANLVIVRTTVGTHVDPLHLFAGLSFAAASVLGIKLLCTASALLLAGFIGEKASRDARLLAFGAAAAGLVSMVFLKHPEDSQNYFWYAGFLFWILIGCSLFVYLTRSLLLIPSITVALSLFGLQLANHPQNHLRRFWLISFAVGIVMIIAQLIWQQRRKTHRIRELLPRLIALAAIVVLGLTPLRAGTVHWSFTGVGTSQHVTSISSTQLRALHFIAAHTDPYALVLTNQNCQQFQRSPTICPAESKTASPWFLTSAFSGRRVLFESRGYSWQLTDPTFDSVEQMRDRELSQEFLLHPNHRLLARLKQKGVASIFINPAFANAGDYSSFARLAFKSADAQVWLLR